MTRNKNIDNKPPKNFRLLGVYFKSPKNLRTGLFSLTKLQAVLFLKWSAILELEINNHWVELTTYIPFFSTHQTQVLSTSLSMCLPRISMVDEISNRKATLALT